MILMMTTYGTLDYLKGQGTQRRYKGAGGQLVTKQFNYHGVFRNYFNYRHQVDDNNNWRHSPISVERTWSKKYWPNWCYAYFLALTEISQNYLWGYLVDGVDVEPQLNFLHQLRWEMVENILYEQTESGGVDGRRLRSRRGVLGDYEPVTDPKYCENGLLMRINGGGSLSPTRSRYATTEAAITKKSSYCICNKVIFLCAEFYATNVLDADT